MKSRGVVLLALAAALAFGACDDVSPITYVEPTRDAAPDHIDSDYVQRCRECTEPEGAICREHYDSCVTTDPRCATLLECMVAGDCWRQMDASNLADLPACAIDCLGEASLSGVNEIASPALNFYLCILDPARCASQCTQPIPRATDGGDASTE